MYILTTSRNKIISFLIKYLVGITILPNFAPTRTNKGYGSETNTEDTH